MIGKFYDIKKYSIRKEYQGFKYYILFPFACPCAYIRIPKGHALYRIDYSKIYLNVHGGLTFGGDHIYMNDLSIDKGWFIGWDYGHAGDQLECECSEYMPKGKIWTIEEITRQCKNAIDDIIDGKYAIQLEEE